ncbi:hypothetical protein TRVA0_034S00496 [Trichomonascus vanleenenianus]|uniref:chalcone isomerase domain-containing protein n=1 Tax=Trichomonascus vanleenenianus TaxID=2268995 RepID=UPI003ECAB755
MLRGPVGSILRGGRVQFTRQFGRSSRYTRHRAPFGSKKLFFAGVLTGGLLTYWYTSPPSAVIRSDASNSAIGIKVPEGVQLVQPETKTNPFPATFAADGEDYSLLGVGVRSVSFLGIQVYAVGVYIADQDKPKVKQLLGTVTYEELLDAEKSGPMISKLLNNGVRIDIRIVPVRNTDFGHMRDGFVRTTLANPRFKAEGSTDEFAEGLNELKRAFARKMAVPKNKIIHLNRGRDGVLNVTFYKAESENEGNMEHLGSVKMPLVSEFLFLQYLSGKKPSSESARQAAVKALAELTN